MRLLPLCRSRHGLLRRSRLPSQLIEWIKTTSLATLLLLALLQHRRLFQSLLQLLLTRLVTMTILGTLARQLQTLGVQTHMPSQQRLQLHRLVSLPQGLRAPRLSSSTAALDLLRTPSPLPSALRSRCQPPQRCTSLLHRTQQYQLQRLRSRR